MLIKNHLLLFLVLQLVGCSDLHLRDDWWKGFSGFAQELSQRDCQVYNSSSSQYDDCMEQINTFYKEQYQ